MDRKAGIIVFLLIAATVAILGATLTVQAQTTDNGTVHIKILTSTEVNWTVDTVEFGTGRITPPNSYATIDSNATTSTNWTNTTDFCCYSGSAQNSRLTMENIGTQNVTINLTSNVTAATFIGGTAPLFQWMIVQNESSDACNEPGGMFKAWADVNSTSPGRACNRTPFIDGRDEWNLTFKVGIPYDAAETGQGDQYALITATFAALGN